MLPYNSWESATCPYTSELIQHKSFTKMQNTAPHDIPSGSDKCLCRKTDKLLKELLQRNNSMIEELYIRLQSCEQHIANFSGFVTTTTVVLSSLDAAVNALKE